jgi:hypothetical protein
MEGRGSEKKREAQEKTSNYAGRLEQTRLPRHARPQS